MCEKYSSRHHKTYLLTCSQCKEAKCKACFMLKTMLKILIKFLDDDGLSYLENFIVDFLNISDINIKKCFNVEKNTEYKKIKNTFDIKVYNKSKKNRAQVVTKTLEDCARIQYHSKGRKRIFYKKS